MALCVLLVGLRLFAGPLHLGTSKWPASKWNFSWYGPNYFGNERAQVEQGLEQLPGQQLAIVRYSSGHNSLDEWVYNAPDIDGSKVIWAREMNTANNLELIHYYQGRQVWLVQPDTHPAEVSSYPVPEQERTSATGSRIRSWAPTDNPPEHQVQKSSLVTSSAEIATYDVVERHPPQPAISYACSLFSYAILAGGMLTGVVAVCMVVVSYSPLPFWDHWTQIERAASGRSVTSFSWLWQQHNEHRLLLPKLFLAADLLLFKGQQRFLLTSIFVIQLLHWCLLCWSTWVLGKWRGALWRTGAGLAAFCLFCPAQWENMVWGFQVCFVLPQLLATASIVALLLYWRTSQGLADQHPPVRFLVLSIVAAIGASYSLASGILLWPILLVSGIYLRLRLKAILPVVIAGVLSIGAYLFHYVRPSIHANPLASLHHPIKLIEYCSGYFLGSWLHRGMHTTESVGLVFLIITIMFLLPALSNVGAFRLFATQLVLMIVFYLGTSAVTAAGRLNFGIAESLVSRYQTVALLYWCCVGLLLLGATFYACPRLPYAFLAAQFCLLVILIRGAATAAYPINEATLHGVKQREVSAALVTGIYDSSAVGATYSFTDVVLKGVAYIKANRLSVFSDGDVLVLGKPLKSAFSPADTYDCTGAAETVIPVQSVRGPAVRISGWAWDTKRQASVSSIVVTVDGIISGFGTAGESRPDISTAYPAISSNYSGFVAFSPRPRLDAVMNIYAVLQGNPRTACHLPVTFKSQ